MQATMFYTYIMCIMYIFVHVCPGHQPLLEVSFQFVDTPLAKDAQSACLQAYNKDAIFACT